MSRVRSASSVGFMPYDYRPAQKGPSILLNMRGISYLNLEIVRQELTTIIFGISLRSGRSKEVHRIQ